MKALLDLGEVRLNGIICPGHEAAIIGEVVNEHPGRVVMKTRLGASRIVDVLVGELLPRIC